MDGPYSTLVQAVFLLAAIFGLIIAGVAVVKRIRRYIDDEAQVTSDMITTFRQLHGRGDLSDEEYRTIETVLENEKRKDSRDDGQ